MGATSKVSVKRKVFPKGQIVIPVALTGIITGNN